ncbi:MAG: sigma-54-dependent Fis family transcriptional regulator, partial [Gemmatimonadetes bacterium]|nr:sigma-54-dependent Fis family transcriptional regulator [Gemmatimonadota bacterium]
EAVALLETRPFDLVLLDLRMPGMDGLTALEVLRTRGLRTPVLMISGFGTIDTAVESLHRGADHFLSKPVDPDLLSAKVWELLERRPAESRVHEGALGSMVGHSEPMREVFGAVRKVAPTDTTVLVQGETGTGKELLARAVHDLSARASGPFIAVNCAGLAEGVLESELFGHVRGAFTGATSDRAGLFAAADGGTLFLDEVGDVSLALQQRLLRVLQEREITPVGSSRPRAVDVRVVAATHRNLRAEVDAGRFREDLYYRLDVFRIEVPPLRERRSDLPILVEAALVRLRERSTATAPTMCSPLAMRLLRAHSWPGNVRELFAVVESAAIRAAGPRIEAQHLPPAIRDPAGSGGGRSEGRYRGGGTDDERSTILAALHETGGSRSRAAELLGMSRTTLWRRMREFGLTADDD